MSDSGNRPTPSVEELQPHFPQIAIERFVAEGGMGAVYRARQTSVDRVVALKILPPALALDAEFRQRFAMEAKAMARLSHRNLVQLYDFGESGGITWMIQEWVQGRDFFQIMHEEGRLSPPEAAALVAQVCDGLGYAHKQGIIHRDVKPANIMQNAEGIVKLMDFGLARSLRGGPESLTAPDGSRFATEEYAPPEVWDPCAEIDHRADIFALGVLLYEALTGERPTGTFRSPSEVVAGLDARFDDVVIRAMQRRPENRYQSCGALLSALREVVSKPPPPPPPPPQRPTTSLKLKLGTGAVPADAPAAPPKAMPAPAGGASEPPETAAVPVDTGGSLGTGAVVALSLVGLLTVAFGVWVVMAKLGDDSSQPAAAGGAQNGGAAAQASGGSSTADPEPGGADNENRPPTPQELVERRAREQRERLEKMRSENPPPAENPPPPPAPEDFAAKLKKLDDELRQAAAEPLKGYQEARAAMMGSYGQECAKRKQDAIERADVDALVLWHQERKHLERRLEPPGNDAGVPDEVVALRTGWRERLAPLREKLEVLHVKYLEDCGRLEAEANEEPDKKRARARYEAVRDFPSFVALCAGSAPPFPEPPREAEPTGPAGELPEDLRGGYVVLKEVLGESDGPDAEGRAVALIKAYGKKLVAAERDLNEAGRRKEAETVAAVKQEMIALLSRFEKREAPAPDPPRPPQPRPGRP